MLGRKAVYLLFVVDPISHRQTIFFLFLCQQSWTWTETRINPNLRLKWLTLVTRNSYLFIHFTNRYSCVISHQITHWSYSFSGSAWWRASRTLVIHYVLKRRNHPKTRSHLSMLTWVVTPCGPVGRYQCFGGTQCLYLQGWSFSPEALCSSETLVSIYKSTWRYNLEGRHRRHYRCENIESRTVCSSIVASPSYCIDSWISVAVVTIFWDIRAYSRNVTKPRRL
jgi:hypothetical protein